MTRVHVDMNLCQSHGECVYVAPDIFELGDDDVLRWREEIDAGRARARPGGGRRLPDARDPPRRLRCRPIVIVGASLAGLRAAQAVRAAGLGRARVVLVGDEPHRPYTRPPLSKEVLDGRHELETGRVPVRRARRRVAPRHAGDRARRRGPHGHDRRRAARLRDADRRHRHPRPRVAGGDRAERPHAARPRRRDPRSRRRWPRARAVAIVGAGFIGCEVASSARKLGLEVTLHRRRAAADAGARPGARRAAAPTLPRREHGGSSLRARRQRRRDLGRRPRRRRGRRRARLAARTSSGSRAPA